MKYINTDEDDELDIDKIEACARHSPPRKMWGSVKDTTSTGNNSSTKKSVINPLEKLVQLAETAKGPEVLELITQAIETPGVHVFGELLDLPNIKELENGPHHIYWNTLNLFAYETYKEYLANKEKYLDLTPTQIQKLQLLTIATVAAKTKYIPYSILMEELNVENFREVQHLIIEAFYADIIKGKMDQQNSQLEVHSGLGRDVRPTDLRSIAETLTTLGQSCQTILPCIEQQINRATSEKEKANNHKEKIQQDIANIRKAYLARTSTAGSSGGEARKKKC